MNGEVAADAKRGPRRVVAGRAADGRSGVLADGERESQLAAPNVVVTELWKLGGVPAALSARDGCDGDFELAPAGGGVIFRHIVLPPDEQWKSPTSGAELVADDEGFHQTATVDFVVITRGEVWCRTEAGEARLAAGDTLVQLGGNHAWSVRNGEPCEMVAVLVDAQASEEEEKEE